MRRVKRDDVRSGRFFVKKDSKDILYIKSFDGNNTWSYYIFYNPVNLMEDVKKHDFWVKMMNLDEIIEEEEWYIRRNYSLERL